MKIIHSFWSKPYALKNMGSNSYGGWCNPIFFYLSWALSCSTFKRFYSDVELYTDECGHELLINKLKLPYTRCHIVLDSLNNYDEELWAIGKLFTYAQQEEPFIHTDYDVFIWKKFPNWLEQSPLIAQHLEKEYPYSIKVIDDAIAKFHWLPDCITKSENKYNEANAGILGGTDINFIREYCEIAFKLIDKNADVIKNLKYPGMVNTVVEQYLYLCLSLYKDTPIRYAFENVDSRFQRFGKFESIPHDAYYIHTLAFYKTVYAIGENIAYHLYKIDPTIFKRVVSLYKDNELCLM